MMNDYHAQTASQTLLVASIQDLADFGVSDDVIEFLTELKESGFSEYAIVVVFLNLLLQRDWFKKEMSKILRRVIMKTYKQLPPVKDEITGKLEKLVKSMEHA